jgi:hypothetical protein
VIHERVAPGHLRSQPIEHRGWPANGGRVGGEVLNGDLAWGPEIRFLALPKPSIISKLPTWRVVAKAILLAMKYLPKSLLRRFLMGFVTTYLASSHKRFQEVAILINKDGKRFCDELNRPQNHIGLQPD